MDKQAIFDKAVRGLESQSWERSVNPTYGSTCMYRNGRGMKCAIGWCFNDEDYNEDMDKCNDKGKGTSIGSRTDIQALLGVETNQDVHFLSALQGAHDAGRTPLGMRNNFRQVAKDFNLECRIGYDG